MIHSTAIISPKAIIGKNVLIGPYVVVEDDVIIDDNSQILAGSILQNGTRLGKNCYIGPYASIATIPMDSHFKNEASLAIIGDNVQIRNYVTVSRASGENKATVIANNTMIMPNVHVAHNCQIGKEVVIVSGVKLGGHVEIEDYAFISANTLVHQFCRIGKYALTAAGSGINRDVLPFSMVYGHQAKHFRLNKIGLERRGIVGERYKLIEKAIRAFRKKDWALLNELATQSEDIRDMLEYKQSSPRGILSFV